MYVLVSSVVDSVVPDVDVILSCVVLLTDFVTVDGDSGIRIKEVESSVVYSVVLGADVNIACTVLLIVPAVVNPVDVSVDSILASTVLVT